MKFYIFTFLLLFAIQWLLDLKIRIKRDYGYGGHMYETNGYKAYILTLGFMSAVLIISFWFVEPINPLIGIFLMAIMGARAAFEWKYIRDTNRHKVSLILVGISLVVTVLFFFLWKVYYK
jgi:high-affinity Fe2+/Pb2+ permease